ncbi:hypothetical protein LF1_05580 [Rubripirellula obstinata]|uniref:DUF1569 domain-containing protein n=1 Tax=Rubripirellula obstinata TaxID=406547 RepID=A0A5B1CF03_9BACT|nr:DUF1569 domain-containing protein [Rubripirellula obstinata]KAA1258043.1 hypothetical protein LF1_05580 [Rubripirellula obstinata]
MAATQKRTLDFHTGDEVIAEIQNLRSSGYAKTKNWNLTQICEHFTSTMVGEMEGLGFRFPWIVRATFGKWLTHRFLKTRKMPGVPTLPSLQPKSLADSEDDTIIEGCIRAISQCETFAGSLDDYPFVDNLDHDEWRQLMWVHAGHHLSFLIPNESSEI